MAKQFPSLDEHTIKFIEAQKIFFVGTAGPQGKVNVSPKGMDTFRILDNHRIIWLNLTGSGNETAAHLRENGRITIMFCAFEGKPLILRLYGTGKIIHPRDVAWNEFIHNIVKQTFSCLLPTTDFRNNPNLHPNNPCWQGMEKIR